MVTKTILLEIDVEEGEDAAVKELLAYLAYTKRIKKYLWSEKTPSYPRRTPLPAASEVPGDQAFAGGSSEAVPSQEEEQPLKQTDAGPKTAQGSSQMMLAMLDSLSEWKKQNKLIRLKALKGKGKFLDIACKIVSYDGETGTMTVYDVDRKIVETVRLTEIEDIGLAL